LDNVDALLETKTSVVKIMQATNLTRVTIVSRRSELGLPGSASHMPDSVRARILELAATITPDRIAVEVNVDPAKVWRFMKARGLVDSGPNRGPIDPQMLQFAAELLADKASYAEASRSTGIDEKTLARHFPDAGADRDFRVVQAAIVRSPGLRNLHLEIMGGTHAAA